MTKVIVVLLIGLVFESAGVVLLKKGVGQIGEPKTISAGEIARVVKAGATNPQVLWGVFFEALFFGTLVFLLAKSDISFLWPLTGLSFVFATFAAMWFLHERVSGLRWAGVALIMAGAALISYTEHAKRPAFPSSSTSAPAQGLK